MPDKPSRTTELLEQASKAIEGLFETEQYKKYLTALSKFHDYSPRNVALINAQMPTASAVAGYRRWEKEFNRHVQKGEKGISIIAYAPRKARANDLLKANLEKIEGEEDKDLVAAYRRQNKELEELIEKHGADVKVEIPSYRAVSVFDVSQTTGEPLPEKFIPGPELIDSDTIAYGELFSALEASSPMPIAIEPIDDPEVGGYCSYKDKRIVVSDSLSNSGTIATTIHEIAHARLHQPSADPPTRRMREVQAESVAFVTAEHFGLDTSQVSFPYIASWSSDKSLKELTASLSVIQRESDDLISEIERRFLERGKAQDKASERPAESRSIKAHLAAAEKRKASEEAPVPPTITKQHEGGENR